MRKPDFQTYIASGKNNLVNSKKRKEKKKASIGSQGPDTTLGMANK